MRLKNSTALLTIGFSALTAAPALADITANDIWNSYQAIAQTVGGELTATTTRDGNTVAFTDAKLHVAFPDDKGSLDVFYPTLSYTDNGDGTVSMDMEGDQVYKLVITGINPATDMVSAELVFNYSDAELIASGDPDDITFSYAMDGFTFALQNLTADGIPGSADFGLSLTGENSDLSGSSQIILGDLITITDQSKMSALSYKAEFKDQLGVETVTSATYMDISSNLSVALPTGGMSVTNLAAALKQGLSVELTTTTGNTTMQDGEQIMSETATGDSSSGLVSANDEAIQLTAEVADMSMDMAAGAEFPFDLSAKMARFGVDFKMPVTATEAPQDFTVAFNLGDLTIGEDLWSLFDPAAVLPRDPATLLVSLTGQATLLQDLLNFTEMMELAEGNLPVELNALTIKDFLISAAGASLSGTGDFVFNNDDLTSFDGMPAPSGTADLQITGANGLIDKLIELGFVEESDAMGARMMMGMMAVPGDGDDTLKSSLEITEDGQITANGQRIK
jgi:hypothetical protein